MRMALYQAIDKCSDHLVPRACEDAAVWFWLNVNACWLEFGFDNLL